MNNEIKNPKMEVKDGKELNDKDYITCLLSSLKEMSKNYVVALTEASNEFLFKQYKEMFEDYINMQREVYELMFKKGWYVLEEAPSDKINYKYKLLNEEFNSLNK